MTYYLGEEEAGIDIELLVNGQDADELPGPTLIIGWWSPWLQVLTWTFIVSNTGVVPLSNMKVISKVPDYLECSASLLAPGASMICQAWTRIVSGANVNFGKAEAASPCGLAVSDQDLAHYFGDPARLGLGLKVLINGQDASQPAGPELQIGTQFSWTLAVVNTGNLGLSIEALTPMNCPRSSLSPGEVMNCTGMGYVMHSGQGQVVAHVRGFYLFRPPPSVIEASAIGYYVGVAPP
jgi:hypothetical protein